MNAAPVSVIIPAYNCQEFIASAINSILDQTIPVAEILVINDGSTDNTLQVLESFGNKIVLLDQKNKRQAAARNNGIKNAKHEILGFLDADDLWPQDHIESLLPLVSEESEYEMARGKTEFFGNVRQHTMFSAEPIYFEAVVGACLYKKSVFEKVGLFDETMIHGEDFDFALRLREEGIREARTPKTTLLYRRHAHNETNSAEKIKQGQMLSLKKKLERQRAREQHQ